jgi:hydroxymethylpyrimidine pyrophosphatase-like HAD family hydrolase
MPLAGDVEAQLRDFLARSRFHERGAVITDLDGTAVHEFRGRIVIPQQVELGLKRLYDAGRPFVLNSLRFPMSVLRTFGREWYAVSNAPIPVVALNGSLLGHVIKSDDGELAFEELAAFPLRVEEIDEALAIVRGLLEAKVKSILLFYYPRDWRVGEVIWTPVAEQVLAVKEKYVSASSVTAVTLDTLRTELVATDVCMIFLLVNVPEDQRMAYQHTKRNPFVTHAGVDKLSGARVMAERLGIDLGDSIGAGDTELDTFLSGVGMAALVGEGAPDLHGLAHTVRLKDSAELGELLFHAAAIHAGRR